MTARRPLPYAAVGLIDEALMALSEARRQMRPLLEKGDIETVARAGRVMDQVNQAMQCLKGAQQKEG